MTPSASPAPRGTLLQTWRYLLMSAIGQFSRHRCTDLAASLTYYSVLAVFPALLALVSLLGVLGNGERTVQAMLDLLDQLGQPELTAKLAGPIEAMVTGGGAGVTLALGIATALFSASGYVGAFGRSLNRIYGVPEGRPIWVLRPFLFLITLGLVVLAAAVLFLLVISGPIARKVGELIGAGSQTLSVWTSLQWPVVLVIVMVMVAGLYYLTPNVRLPRFRIISAGAALAIIVWVIASVGFGFYVSNFAKYNATYGSLAGVIVFLLWLWLTNLVLLFGAELDVEVLRLRQLARGIPADAQVQLPLKGARDVYKLEDARDKRAAEGRVIRMFADELDVPDGTSFLDRFRLPKVKQPTVPLVELEALPSQRGEPPP